MSRRRVPENVKSITGTLRPDRARLSGVPPGVLVAPPMPDNLRPLAVTYWHGVILDSTSAGTLRVEHGALYAMYANCATDCHELRTELEKSGRVYRTVTANGAEMMRLSPLVNALDSAERRLLLTLNALGLSPKTRQSLETPVLPTTPRKDTGTEADFY